MRYLLFVAIALSGCATSSLPSSVSPAPNHPILGSWKFVLPKGDCSEVYTFRPDGTRSYSSNEESGESTYEVAATPSAAGFYKLIDTITKNNGKLDCSGGTIAVGHQVRIYVRMHSTGSKFIMCRDESFENCFGPFVRVQEK